MASACCPRCGRTVAYEVESRTETHAIRDEDVSVQVQVAICTMCGADLSVDELDDAALDASLRQYRARHGMMQPEQIRELRSRYGVGQKAFARLLGWGDVTLARYEAGSLQSASHDTALRLADDPDNARVLLRRNGDRLTPKQRYDVERRIAQWPSVSNGPSAMSDGEQYVAGVDPVGSDDDDGPMTTPAIDIGKLAPEERLRLIDDLWESLRAHPEALQLTDAQRAELDRRIDAVESGNAEVVAWDEAKRRLKGR